MIYRLGETLEAIEENEETYDTSPLLYVVKFNECRDILNKLGIVHEGEIEARQVEFCKVETQQEYITGTIAAPKLLDVLGKRYRLQFFIDKNNMIIADDEDFSLRIVQAIQREKIHQADSIAMFIYNFMLYIMKRDNILLEQYENTLMKMEEDITNGKTMDFHSKLMPVRKALLTLRNYYDQLSDMGNELEDNENNFFAKKQLRYFGVVSNRAERYKDKTIYLLEYALQVRDAYQAQVDANQNKNMQVLTVISTIILPLTLITSWYGMNFKNMPELENGYPYVIVVCVLVVIICIFIFKKKKIL